MAMALTRLAVEVASAGIEPTTVRDRGRALASRHHPGRGRRCATQGDEGERQHSSKSQHARHRIAQNPIGREGEPQVQADLVTLPAMALAIGSPPSPGDGGRCPIASKPLSR